MSFPLRRDISGVIHYEMVVPGRNDPDCWTPLCYPNVDWLNLVDSTVKDGAPTCFWCLAESRFK